MCVLLDLNSMFTLSLLNLQSCKDCFKEALVLHIQPELGLKVYVKKSVYVGIFPLSAFLPSFLCVYTSMDYTNILIVVGKDSV